MKRRNFIKKTASAGLLSGVLINSSSASTLSKGSKGLIQNPDVKPTVAQKRWMDLGFGMFIHFGINTYYDVEWSEGDLDVSAFNPKKIDTDLWCQTAKKAGMKYLVITTKHHDGFCLWPSKYSDYTVAASPFKQDVLQMLAKSAEKYDLKLGFYFSLWDRYDPLYDTDWDGFMKNMKGQIEELVTGYGPLCEFWMDGFWKKQKSGWTKKNKEIEGEANKQEKDLERDFDFIQAWRNEGAYWWQMDTIYQMIKSHQPQCMVMNNSTTAYPGVPLHPVDIRSGEKYTDVKADKKVWNWLGQETYFPLQIETTMSVKGNEKFPSGNWFWHANDHSVRSKESIQELLDTAGKMEANLLLNVGISDQGLLRKEDKEALESLGS
ncbi:MAG: alpha-L-fucosidase [Ekhidna sp.]|nr:alpha-L-fucosidase [Ekhidna sp.]